MGLGPRKKSNGRQGCGGGGGGGKRHPAHFFLRPCLWYLRSQKGREGRRGIAHSRSRIIQLYYRGSCSEAALCSGQMSPLRVVFTRPRGIGLLLTWVLLSNRSQKLGFKMWTFFKSCPCSQLSACDEFWHFNPCLYIGWNKAL